MNIFIGKTSGFCNGVSNTIKQAQEILKLNNVYCLGEIVHNERVIKDLEEQGMIPVYNIEEVPNDSKLIIRAHGELKETYNRAKEKNVDIIDLTCGKIKAIRVKISKRIDNHFIVIIGKKNHPESLGVLSFSGDNSMIIEDEEDIKILINKIKDNHMKKIYVVSQTTFNSLKFDELVEMIKEKVNMEVVIDKTICNATNERQEETKELSKNVDTMIIVGGKNSSNTKELEIIAKKYCNNVMLIQNKDDIDISNLKGNNIGIMAGASTPNIVVEEIVEKIKSRV